MKRNQFQQGAGVYTCRICQRRSRGSDDSAQLHLCGECFDIASMENGISDEGDEAINSYGDEILRLIGELRAKHAPLVSHWDELEAQVKAYQAAKRLQARRAAQQAERDTMHAHISMLNDINEE